MVLLTVALFNDLRICPSRNIDDGRSLKVAGLNDPGTAFRETVLRVDVLKVAMFNDLGTAFRGTVVEVGAVNLDAIKYCGKSRSARVLCCCSGKGTHNLLRRETHEEGRKRKRERNAGFWLLVRTLKPRSRHVRNNNTL